MYTPHFTKLIGSMYWFLNNHFFPQRRTKLSHACLLSLGWLGLRKQTFFWKTRDCPQNFKTVKGLEFKMAYPYYAFVIKNYFCLGDIVVLPGTYWCFLIQFMNNGHSLILFCKQLYFFILAGKAEYSFLLSGLIWYLLAFLSKTKHALVHSYHYR